MRGFEALPRLIRAAGTDTVFAMLGGTNVPWVAAGVEAGEIRLVKTRHEASAVSAACAFSRVTGQIGVATVTRGPGFANAINALFAASTTHTPMILIVAESPATRAKTTQNIPQLELSGLVGAGFHHVTVGSELENAYRLAVGLARWNGAPQVLSIGDGVIDDPVELTDVGRESSRAGIQVDDESIAAAVATLAGARRPLIIAGQGAVLAGARDQIWELADLVGAFVANSLMANRFFSGHPRDLGISGSWSAPAARDFIADVDVVLSLGASLNDNTTAERKMFPGARIIHCEIDIEQPCLASSPELALFGDVRDAVDAMSEAWRHAGHRTPVRDACPTREQIRRSVLDVDLLNDPERGIDLRTALDVIDRRSPDNRIVVTDSGRHLASVVSLIDAADASSWVVSRGYGTIGLGLGAAIGAAASAKDRPVLFICGDGGFMMAAQELDALRVNGLDLTVAILNDEQYGSEVKYLNPYQVPQDVIRQTLPDIYLLAQAFGGVGAVIRTLDELETVEMSGPGLRLYDIRIDPQVSGNGPF